MRKIVYLHKRGAGLDVQEFHREMASLARLNPEIPQLARYVQSHSLLRGYRKGELLFDAVEEFEFPSAQAADRFAGSTLARAVQRRRREIVADSATVVMMIDVHVVKPGIVVGDAVKNIEFVNRRPSMELAPFRRYWRDVHGPMASKIPSIIRYEQNHLSMESYASGATPRYDGLAVTWFTSTAAMREGAASAEYADTRADEANFLPDGHLPILIVREAYISTPRQGA